MTYLKHSAEGHWVNRFHIFPLPSGEYAAMQQALIEFIRTAISEFSLYFEHLSCDKCGDKHLQGSGHQILPAAKTEVPPG